MFLIECKIRPGLRCSEEQCQNLMMSQRRGYFVIKSNLKIAIHVKVRTASYELFCESFYDVQGPPKRPDTFENLIEIKRVDENN